ncbi:hypothetical protein ACFFUT_09765 [Pseudohalocynthiibacter aestuariivivens]|uniref:Uncharacterized protein n=1 Tax=Pseudohalocynthiibacter aestuariivivens TaxID=1591409 RepID=A0ABV5JF29_9RHOB|nr:MULTISPECIES: hypothetical protein [Pseudohalocynthiibacter]MBS9717893.1 hypothetical protein [Pseudohalocynthiibacter aestuariivivens]MCK0102957.1 hypothetical protein [Pseudohalocynthiibacter sp. F2068]
MSIFDKTKQQVRTLTMLIAITGSNVATTAHASDQPSPEEMASEIVEFANTQDVPNYGPGTEVRLYADGAAVVREIRLTDPELEQFAKTNSTEMLALFAPDYQKEVCSSWIGAAFVRRGVVYRTVVTDTDRTETARFEVDQC